MPEAPTTKNKLYDHHGFSPLRKSVSDLKKERRNKEHQKKKLELRVKCWTKREEDLFPKKKKNVGGRGSAGLSETFNTVKMIPQL